MIGLLVKDKTMLLLQPYAGQNANKKREKTLHLTPHNESRDTCGGVNAYEITGVEISLIVHHRCRADRIVDVPLHYPRTFHCKQEKFVKHF